MHDKESSKYTLGGMSALGTVGAMLGGPGGALTGGIIGGVVGYLGDRVRRSGTEKDEQVESQ